jgi:hypothetical protein
MTFLLNLLRIATITHKTVAAIGATLVITVGVREYLRKHSHERY